MRSSFIQSVVCALGACVLVASMPARGHAQTPQEQPLVAQSDVTYVGSFTVPNPNWNTQEAWHYGGFALGMGPDGRSLYMGGHAWYSRLGRISIPSVGGTAAQQIVPTEVRNRAAIDPDDQSGQPLGGSLVHNNRLIVSAYVYYDGDRDAVASHFVASPDLSSWSGPYRVGAMNPGFVGGYMASVPDEWRALLGGPALTGQCCIPIISRTSTGPSASVFDPDHLGVASEVPATMLLGYPQGNENLGTWSSSGTLANGATAMAGVAFVPGTRSLLFVGRKGDGPFCYGPGTADPALAGTPDGQGNVWCYDPQYADKGVHGYPYRHFVWAYDANDLAAVKAGTRQPWDVRPYATWYLDGANSNGTASARSMTFDPATRRIYMTEAYGDAPRVHVWQVGIGTYVAPPPPPPPTEVCGDGVDNDGDGLVDEGCTVAPTPTPPGPPQQLEGRVADSDTVTLQWLAPLTGDAAANYLVEAGFEAGQTAYTVELGATVTGIEVPRVGPGRYYIRTRARNSAGASEPSNEVIVTVGCSSAPKRVKNVKARTRGELVNMTWADPDGCAGTAYAVAIGSQPGLADVATLQTESSNLKARGGAGTYYARVIASNHHGVSEPSEEVELQLESGCLPPPFQLRLSATVNGSMVRLAWEAEDAAAAAQADALYPVAFRLEVGSGPGQSDLAVVPLGRASSMTALAPAGDFYVRVRPTDVCGAGAASNEYLLKVR
jgi:hypothetical protein